MIKSLTLLFVLIYAISNNALAQDDNKLVTLTVSNQGEAKETARQNALRTAIEQAFGAFISSKTEIFNDQLVADQMTSVSSGNIQSYEILNEARLPDGRWSVTLKAIVSVNKLTSFAQAKGINVEIKGGLFAINIKQQMLNEQGEIDAIVNMIGVVHEVMQTAFDYEIKAAQPISNSNDNTSWKVPLTVFATANNNIKFCANYMQNTLKSLSLSPAEIENYKSLNKAVYPVVIIGSDVKINYRLNLRTYQSAELLVEFGSKGNSYINGFNVPETNGFNNPQQVFVTGGYVPGDKSSFKEAYEREFQKHDDIAAFFITKIIVKTETKEFEFDFFDLLNHNLSEDDLRKLNLSGVRLSFWQPGQLVAEWRYKDKKSLSEIESMSGYSIKPSGIRLPFK